jgi:hypothetical protein
MRDDQLAQLKSALRPFGEEAIQPGDVRLLKLIDQVLTGSGLVRVERLAGTIPANFHAPVNEASVIVSHPSFSSAVDLATLLEQLIASIASEFAEELTGGDPGDVIYFDDDGMGARLPIGTADQTLSVDSGTLKPEWTTPPVASDTVAGKVELATTAETTTGTDATRAVTPDGLHDMTSLAGAAWFLDEDNMASNSDTKVPSQQSVKAYVDAGVGGVGTYSDEQAQDAIASAFAAGSQSGITVTYTDASNKFDFVVAASGVQPLLTWKSGTYHGSCSFPGLVGSPFNKSITADRLYAHPMLVPKSTSFDQIIVNINSSAAGNVHMGIYEMGSDGLPGALVVDAGATSVATTGDKTATLSLTLAAGWYWISSLFSAFPTVKAYNPPASPSSFLGNIVGPTETGQFFSAVYRSFSYAALPNPFGSITGYTDEPPRVMVRVS